MTTDQKVGGSSPSKRTAHLYRSLLTYHPEKFYPQQIDALPEASEFWEGIYQKEQWEQYDEAQHPFFDSWLQEMQDITQEMWQEF
jgi:hypothetical protein